MSYQRSVSQFGFHVRFSPISLLVEFATHRPNSLLQLAEFGLAVNEKWRNNLYARWY